MDPDATLRDLIDAAVAGDWQALDDHAGNLVDWLANDGFTPADPRQPTTTERQR